MKDLLEKLAALADELDQIEAPEIADEVDSLMKGLREEVAQRAKEEESYMTICPECEGSGAGIDSPWCEMCKGEGFVKGASVKLSYIRHEDGKWNVYSQKGKRLGSYSSQKKAKERLNQIEMFKHMKNQ